MRECIRPGPHAGCVWSVSARIGWVRHCVPGILESALGRGDDTYALPVHEQVDIAIVGAGAAGLMAAIWAGRTAASLSTAGSVRIIALDGAAKLGAKILVAGGGRCNVTHHAVDESAYAGSSRHAIRKVLRSFDVPQTTAFFRELGVELKREETGKLFPVTDDAHTVLDALLAECARVGVALRHPWRVEHVERDADGFVLHRAGAGGVPSEPPLFAARRVILATGGMALPRTGSDGGGYALAKSLGHSVTARVFPALVPLIVDPSHFVRSLSGITLLTTLTVRSGSGKHLVSFTNSTLCTHFGISGPSVLDASRYFTAARQEDVGATLAINWLPSLTTQQADEQLSALRGAPVGRWLVQPPRALPERLARAICDSAGVDSFATMHHVPRERRRALAEALTAMTLPVTGDRGFTFAEATAGGVPLSELKLDTMESRVCPGLHIIGELCDVDGRVGGFNFQWAWASGALAGRAAAT